MTKLFMIILLALPAYGLEYKDLDGLYYIQSVNPKVFFEAELAIFKNGKYDFLQKSLNSKPMSCKQGKYNFDGYVFEGKLKCRVNLMRKETYRHRIYFDNRTLTQLREGVLVDFVAMHENSVTGGKVVRVKITKASTSDWY